MKSLERKTAQTVLRVIGRPACILLLYGVSAFAAERGVANGEPVSGAARTLLNVRKSLMDGSYWGIDTKKTGNPGYDAWIDLMLCIGKKMANSMAPTGFI